MSNLPSWFTYHGSIGLQSVELGNVIVGQGGSIDDAPGVSAYIAANQHTGYTLTLQNCYLRTPILIPNTAATGSPVINTIYIVGTLKYDPGAEMILPPNTHVVGFGGGQVLQAPLASYSTAAEILITDNQYDAHGARSTGGTLAGYVYAWDVAVSVFPLKEIIGSTITVTAATGGANWVSNTFKCIAAYTDPFGSYNYVRMAWTGSGSLPTGSPTGVSMNDGTYYTTGATVSNNFYLLHITGLVNTGTSTLGTSYVPSYAVQNNALIHWAWISNTYSGNSAAFTNQMWRVMGRTSNADMYVSARTSSFSSPTLPDAGSTGGIYVAELVAPITIVGGNCSVRNLNIIYTPGFSVAVLDAFYTFFDGLTCTHGLEVGAAMVFDGATYFTVQNCHFTAGTQLGYSILFTTSVGAEGVLTAIGYVSNCRFDGACAIFWQTQQFGEPSSWLIAENCFTEGGFYFPNTTYGGFLLLDTRTSYFSGIRISDVSAEAYPTFYGVESVVPLQPLNLGNIYQGASIEWDGVAPSNAYGPNIFNGATSNCHGSQGLVPSSLHGSTEGYGMVNAIQSQQGSNWAPAAVSQYLCTLYNSQDGYLSRLWDLKSWQTVTTLGSVTLANTDAGSNLLVGPDLSLGKVIRVSSASSGALSATINAPGTPAVGDTLIVYAKIKQGSTSSLFPNYGSTQAITLISSNVTTFVNNSASPSIAALGFDVIGTTSWADSCEIFTVTATNGSTSTWTLQLNVSSNTDFIFDPEALAVLYIPASASVPAGEIARLFRKFRTHVNSGVTGSLALPSRSQLAWAHLGNVGHAFCYTTSTGATAFATFVVPYWYSATVKVVWTAVQVGAVSTPVTSGGEFYIICSLNHDSSVTASSLLNASNTTCGVGGAAASTPFTITSAITGSGLSTICTFTINAVAQSSTGTTWSGMLIQSNAPLGYP